MSNELPLPSAEDGFLIPSTERCFLTLLRSQCFIDPQFFRSLVDEVELEAPRPRTLVPNAQLVAQRIMTSAAINRS